MKEHAEASMKKQVRLSDLQFGPIRHPDLPDDFIDRVKTFKAILADVDASSLETTIENFKRDADPKSELIIWERIALTFQTFLSHNPTTDPAIKKDIFAVLLSASTGVEEFENIKHLSDQQIRHLVINYHGLSA
jgi:hypothetical protein